MHSTAYERSQEKQRLRQSLGQHQPAVPPIDISIRMVGLAAEAGFGIEKGHDAIVAFHRRHDTRMP